MKKIIILTGSELRHTFFRKKCALHPEISVLKSFCEGKEKSLENIVKKQDNDQTLRLKHLKARERSEKDFFGLFVKHSQDLSMPKFITKGAINNEENIEAILSLNPDLIIAYGCSIIRSPLLEKYKGRFLNVHLGLSPYYRGSGTNFWPLVNNETEFVGATFMHIDKGVDTGQIIHQMRPTIEWGDTPSQLGNRLIKDMTEVYIQLIRYFDKIDDMLQIEIPSDEKYYRKKDYTEESVIKLYENFDAGLISTYLSERDEKENAVPIIRNPCLSL